MSTRNVEGRDWAVRGTLSPVFDDNIIELNLGNNFIEEIKEEYFNNATIPLAELKLFNCSIGSVTDRYSDVFRIHSHSRLNYGGVHKIRHIACERYLYVSKSENVLFA